MCREVEIKLFQISLLFDIEAVATFDFSDFKVFIQLPLEIVVSVSSSGLWSL